jgi:hypothetical protein
MGQGRSPRPTWQRAIARLQGRETVAESGPLLVLANLVALIGVLFLGWNLAMILVLYWVESGIVGLLNLPKILLARGPLTLTARGVSLAVPMASTGLLSLAARAFTAIFFLIHYGIFWIGHGLFVFLLPAFARQRGGAGVAAVSNDPFAGAGIDPAVVGSAALILLASHAVSFWTNYVRRREYLGISYLQQMAQPYSRVLVMHVTILAGAFLMILIGTPVAALVVLVVMKTLIDLRLHGREHERARRRRAALTPRPVVAGGSRHAQ